MNIYRDFFRLDSDSLGKTATFKLYPLSPGTMLKDAMSADTLQNLSTLIGGVARDMGFREGFTLHLEHCLKSVKMALIIINSTV